MNASTEATTILRDAADFFFQTPLYAPREIPAVLRQVEGITPREWRRVFFENTIDGYCTQCKRITPWTLSSRDPTTSGLFVSQGYWVVSISCTRGRDHYYNYWLLTSESAVTKIGQLPSLADIQLAELDRLRRLLPKDRSSELARGVGLAAHGVGIGSFIYMRRVIEALINEAQGRALADGAHTAEEFAGKRTSERISLLASYLPDFLVRNHSLYGILSKHIHELSEEECLAAFPAIRVAIEMILEEKLEMEARSSRSAAAEQALAALQQRLLS